MNFKENESPQKLRGGYYTPTDLADFLVRWCAVKRPTRILEPSCGDGVFIDSIAKWIGKPELLTFEIDGAEARKSKQRANTHGLDKCQVSNRDFLGWALDAISKNSVRQFDSVVGNPPFVRYQYLPEVFQSNSMKIFESLDCHFTKHTNAWVPFILASIALLRPGGRLGMVVPSEIIHIIHAQSLRTFLGNECKRVVILDPKELWFEGALQGAVLLLAEKKQRRSDSGDGVAILPVHGRKFLEQDPESVFQKPKSINGKTVAGKWTTALIDANVRNLMDSLLERASFKRFSAVADVDVGIVTGANKFFLVDNQTVKKFDLSQYAHPMFGKSDHCPGVIYDERQHTLNEENGKPTNFIWLNGHDINKNRTISRYIKLGEGQSLHTRYKCRVRRPWYLVPSVYSTPVGMLKRSHQTPRLILNRMKALTTDTSYRIRTKVGDPERLVASFMTGLTALSAELEGRHYGGGVLELVPSEIERLIVPHPEHVQCSNIEELDHLTKCLPADQVLEFQTKLILEPLGVSASEQCELLNAWKKLRDRRLRVSVLAA